MKIPVVGSREFFKDKIHEFIDSKNQNLVTEIIAETFQDGTIFISGGANGVDSWAEKIINEINLGLTHTTPIPKIILKPDWDKYGKRAGAIRNQKIVDEADKIIAFWDGKSKGSKITIDMAIKANKPLDIYVR